MIQVTTQLAIFLDNKPGALARVCQELSLAKVNIYALTTSDSVDHCVIRLIVDKAKTALRVMEEHHLVVVESDVIMIEGNNSPGSLGRITSILAAAKINIEYAYCATLPDAKRGLLILRPSHVAKALTVLNQENI